jgi:phage/plasmid-associated DNA primase
MSVNYSSFIKFLRESEIPFKSIPLYKNDPDWESNKHILAPNHISGYTTEHPFIVVHLNMKNTYNFFCLDCDDLDLTHQEICDKMKEICDFVPPYTLSPIKQKPHFYFSIPDYPDKDFKLATDCWTMFKGDLLRQIVVESNKTKIIGLEFDEENNMVLPEVNWERLKPYFKDTPKKTGIKKIIIKKHLVSSASEISSPLEMTDFQKMVAEGLDLVSNTRFDTYENFIKLVFLIINENIPYFVFDEVCKRYKSYNSDNNRQIYENIKNSKDGLEKSITHKSLLWWIKQDNPEKYNDLLVKHKQQLIDPYEELLISANHYPLSQLILGHFGDDLIYDKTKKDYVMYNPVSGLWEYKLDPEGKFLVPFIQNLVIPKVRVILEYKKAYHKELSKKVKILAKSDDISSEDLEELNQKVKDTKAFIDKGKKNIDRLENTGHIEGLRKIIEPECAKYPRFMERYNSNKDIYVFNNGVCLDLNTKQIRKLRREDYATISCGYPYKEPTSEQKQLVLDFVSNYFESNDCAFSFLSMIAGCLRGKNKSEKFYVWSGTGRNGKTTIDTMCKRLFGDYYYALHVNQLTAEGSKSEDAPNAGLLHSKGKRFVIAQEPLHGACLKVNRIKQWTGNDRITTRAQHSFSIVSFDPQFHLFLSCNDIPNLDSKDDAISYRMKICPFIYKFTGKKELQTELEENQKWEDTSIKDIIETDSFLYGFLGVLIDIFMKTEGLFITCDTIENKTNEYLYGQNPLVEWFKDTFELPLQKTAKNKMTTRQLHSEYEEYNKKGIRLSPQKFNRFLEELVGKSNFTKDNTNKGKHFIHLERKQNHSDCEFEEEEDL